MRFGHVVHISLNYLKLIFLLYSCDTYIQLFKSCLYHINIYIYILRDKMNDIITNHIKFYFQKNKNYMFIQNFNYLRKD